MSPADIPAPIDATDPAQPAATLPAPPTRSQGYALERAIRTAAEHQRPVADIVCTGDRRLLPALMARGWVDERGYLTDAGYNAAGVAAPGQPWGGWTVAYRTRTGKNWATTARRVRNWAGTWAQATEMAGALLELLGGDERAQVWYVSTQADERPDEAGYLLLDSGTRMRMIDSGMLPAELLDREVMTVAVALHAAWKRSGQRDYGHADCREMARDYRVNLGPDQWAALVHQTAGDGPGFGADARSHHRYLAQPWCRDERPASWNDEEAAIARFDAALVRLADDVRAGSLVRTSSGAIVVDEIMALELFGDGSTAGNLENALGMRLRVGDRVMLIGERPCDAGVVVVAWASTTVKVKWPAHVGGPEWPEWVRRESLQRIP